MLILLVHSDWYVAVDNEDYTLWKKQTGREQVLTPLGPHPAYGCGEGWGRISEVAQRRRYRSPSHHLKSEHVSRVKVTDASTPQACT